MDLHKCQRVYFYSKRVVNIKRWLTRNARLAIKRSLYIAIQANQPTLYINTNTDKHSTHLGGRASNFLRCDPKKPIMYIVGHQDDTTWWCDVRLMIWFWLSLYVNVGQFLVIFWLYARNMGQTNKHILRFDLMWIYHQV